MYQNYIFLNGPLFIFLYFLVKNSMLWRFILHFPILVYLTFCVIENFCLNWKLSECVIFLPIFMKTIVSRHSTCCVFSDIKSYLHNGKPPVTEKTYRWLLPKFGKLKADIVVSKQIVDNLDIQITGYKIRRSTVLRFSYSSIQILKKRTLF